MCRRTEGGSEGCSLLLVLPLELLELEELLILLLLALLLFVLLLLLLLLLPMGLPDEAGEVEFAAEEDVGEEDLAFGFLLV